MKTIAFYLSVFTLLMVACKEVKNEDAEPKAAFPGFQIPAHFPDTEYPMENNPVTENGFLLGKKLFYDGILSRDGSISCGSCHIQFSAFTHTGHDVSHGIEDRLGTRNSPAIQNMAWSKFFFWDGGVHNLDLLPFNPIENPVEMDEQVPNAVNKLKAHSGYPPLFEKAFGTPEVSGRRMMQALSQFMNMLVSANSRYDQYALGKSDALSSEEKEGLAIFKNKCDRCHTSPLFTDNGFHNNGLQQTNDKGRFGITLNPDDAYKFKTPSLRNLSRTAPYMHDGRFGTLEEVLEHYVSGIRPSATTDSILLGGIALNTHERTRLLQFLKTLDDEVFVRDKRFNE